MVRDRCACLVPAIVTEVTGNAAVSVDMGGSAASIDFTPPFKRVWIVPALEEKLGCKLPDINDPGVLVTLSVLAAPRECVSPVLTNVSCRTQLAQRRWCASSTRPGCWKGSRSPTHRCD